MRLALSLALSAALWSGAAQGQAPADDLQVEPLTEEDEPIVCRKVVEAGTRVSVKKDCRLRSEWTARGQASGGPGESKQMECGRGIAQRSCELTPKPNDPVFVLPMN